MAAKEKSRRLWEEAKEQDNRREKERIERNFIYSYANKNPISADIYLKALTKDMSPEEARDETSRLRGLGSARRAEDVRKNKAKYNRLWSESSVGTESIINRRNLRRDIESTFQEIQKLQSERNRGGRWENERGGRLGTTQEINAFNSEMDRKIKEAQLRHRELKDSLSIFDSQFRETGRSWISQRQAEDDRLAAYNEQKDEQKYNELKYGKRITGDPGGVTSKIQMQMPPQSQPQRKNQPQKQGQPKGMPREMVQSPAMAQKRSTYVTWAPYDAKTGRTLEGEELNNLYGSEYARYKKAGVRPPEGVLNTNPYTNKQWNNPYNRSQRATEYSMANYQNPNAMSNYYQNLNY